MAWNYSTEQLQRLDAAHHLHPFTDGRELNAKGVRIITEANGVFLRDSEGNEILDGMAGLWCVAIGYGREELAEAASRQMKQLSYYNTFFQTSHVPAIGLATRLAELAPGDLNHVFFSSSGSEANDTNIRLVRHYWAAKGKPEKQVIITRWNAYHGSSMGAASLGGMKGMHAQGGLPIPGIAHINQPDWWGEGGDMAPEEFGLARARELEEKILELGEDKVAAFIAEPIQGAGGVIIPPASYWPEVNRILKKYDILMIADEVICGFGRTGEWFGSEVYGIQPDIMTVAKALSSGYMPIGGTIVSDEVAEVIDQGGEFNHGYTYSAHPVAAAVALENLRILHEEGIVTRVKETVGPYIKEKWESLTDHPLVGEAKIQGLIASIALTPDKASRAKFAEEEGTVGVICRDNAIRNGLVMRHVGDRMVIAPPLTISPEEIDLMMERVWQSLDETHEQVKSEGLWQAA
ncbi:aspartate aminotransferase family protein [Methyloligella sp. 2.7D]|uniref:aspartate aminotransferase family protein n=1 Tax=unclassified Methyloligella TaxID=2625955 RepID=UPI00157D8D7E|nr:aspartate aminotransferase family protein [Methyloligella sp. GL2]QKP78157.1 aspartate aminotransferase family protein [Methyloligella sp. GL2]